MPTTAASRKHLVLVHGLCHGAWCWYKVMTHLRSAGHRVSAVDLGGSGVHPSRLDEIATFSDYIQPLVRFLESLSADEKVVLVGHSYGGLAISLAMERFHHIVSVAVFIAAYMPNYKDPPALQMTQVHIIYINVILCVWTYIEFMSHLVRKFTSYLYTYYYCSLCI
ncbi:putative alpha/beta hydrolase-1 [Helianthus annuus]|nr:putative alpha/beta hydrolase-1 [Helianthus annuus]